MSRFIPLLLALLFLAACSRSASYVDRGNKLFAEGKYKDAELNYLKAIQKDAKNGEAFHQLGKTQLKTGRTAQAYTSLKHAVDLLGERGDVKQELADLSLAIFLQDRNHPKGAYDTAHSLADEILVKNPRSWEAMRVNGVLALSDRKFAYASQLFQSANAVRPMQPGVIMGWSETLFADDKVADAERLILQLIDKNKGYGPAYVTLSEHYIRLGRVGDAENILRARVANNPSEAVAVIGLATFYAAQNRMDREKETLQRLLDNPRAFPQARLQVGDFYAALRLPDEAMGQYQEGANARSKDRTVYLRRMADIWLAQGKLEKARPLIADILREQPGDQAARVEQASLMVRGGSPEAISAAVTQLKALVESNPDNPAWHVEYGKALRAQGDISGAAAQFQEAIKGRPDLLEPRIDIAEIAFSRGDYPQALRLADEILSHNPNLARVRLMRAVCLTSTGHPADARKELAILEKALPGNRDVQFQIAVVDLQQKHFPEAAEGFRRLLTGKSDDSQALSGMAETLIATGQPEKAMQILQAELSRSPDSFQVGSLLAGIELRLNKADLAVRQYRNLTAAHPGEASAWRGLGSACAAQGDRDCSIASFQKAAALAPGDGRIQGLLARNLAAAGRKPEAVQSYRRALQLQPDNIPIIAGLAYMLAETGGLDEAQRLVQEALVRDPREPQATDTLGWIFLKKNQTDSALQVFRNLTEQHPESPVYHYHLGLTLLQKGDRSAAKAELTTAVSDKPPDELRRDIEAALARIG